MQPPQYFGEGMDFQSQEIGGVIQNENTQNNQVEDIDGIFNEDPANNGVMNVFDNDFVDNQMDQQEDAAMTSEQQPTPNNAPEESKVA